MAVQPGPLGEPLAPTMIAPMMRDAAGSVAYPRMAFDPTSRVLIVDSTYTPRPAWWEVHGADVGAGLAAAGAVLLVVVWRRAARRPQTAGKLYCRRCNYDLTPVTGSQAPGACPECGPAAKDRSPVSGRPVLRRLAAPMAVLVPAIIAGVWWASSGVEFGTGGRAWPHAGLRKVLAGWPLQRRPVNTTAVRVLRTHRLEPKPDPVGREIRTEGQYGLEPLPDGSGLAWVEFGAVNGWRQELLVRRFDGTDALRVALGSNAEGFARLQGFTPDGRSAVVTMTGLVSPATAPSVTVAVMTVDLTSGAVRRVGSSTTTATVNGASSWTVPGVTATVNGGEDPWWTITTLDGPAAGRQASGGTAPVPTPTAVTAVTPISTWILDEGSRPATLSLDGALAARLDLGPAGYFITIPASSPDGRWYAVALVPPGPGGSGEVRVWDMAEVRKRAGGGSH